MLTIAVLGLGNRGINYARLSRKHGDVRFTALCDFDSRKLKNAVEELDCKEARLFSSAEELFAAGKLADVLYICTQDRDHYAQAMRALDLGYHLLVEKPISPDPMDCIRIAEKAEQVQRNVFVCHVLRYSPFYRRIKKVLEEGVLGDLMLIQHNEHVGFWHFAHSYVRGNWRREDETTPMLMAKCCHDMDLLYWWLGSCKRASSLGSLTYFKPENAPEGAKMYCKDCPHQGTCNYYSVDQYLPSEQHEARLPWAAYAITPKKDADSIRTAAMEGPYGRCVFHSDNDVCDRQIANLVFQQEGREVLVQFSVSAFTIETYRDTHFFGTKGELICNDLTETITLHLLGQEPQTLSLNLADDSMYNGGHAGGDIGLVSDVLDYLSGKEISYEYLTPIQESIESHLIVGACERSRKNAGKFVDIH